MYFSYHVHSIWSDGKAEISDMIAAAGRAGMDEVGISDHYVLTADRRKLDWSMSPDSLSEYVESVQIAAGDAVEGLIVRLGLETDYIPETADDLRGVLNSEPFDYVIGSVHMVDGFCIDDTAELWSLLNQTERDEIIRKYWTRIRQMAESGLFDIVGHLDLYKKFAIYPSIDIDAEISAALDAIAGSGMAVEVNTAGWYLPCREAYPDTLLLRECFKRDIPVVVSADAHIPENICRGYDRAYSLLKSVGYTDLVSFAGRQKIIQPILDNPIEDGI